MIIFMPSVSSCDIHRKLKWSRPFITLLRLDGLNDEMRLLRLEARCNDTRNLEASLTASPQNTNRGGKQKSQVSKPCVHEDFGLKQQQGPSCGIVDELEESREIIAKFRARAVAMSAKVALRNELYIDGRLLMATHIPDGVTSLQCPIDEVFSKYAGGATALQKSEPYLVPAWQLPNLRKLLDALVAQSHVEQVKFTTHSRSE